MAEAFPPRSFCAIAGFRPIPKSVPIPHLMAPPEFVPVDIPTSTDGNPGYSERSFTSWKNRDVALIVRQVIHPDPPIRACSKNNDNSHDHKRINNFLVSANCVVTVWYVCNLSLTASLRDSDIPMLWMKNPRLREDMEFACRDTAGKRGGT